jgi:hypothetical protein
LGIPLASSSPEAKTCLGQLLEDLETEKAAMDGTFTWDKRPFYCCKFSNKVLTRRTERIGWYREARTPEAFYAAASTNLEQFMTKTMLEAWKIESGSFTQSGSNKFKSKGGTNAYFRWMTRRMKMPNRRKRKMPDRMKRKKN